jgi:hypothetical protein
MVAGAPPKNGERLVKSFESIWFVGCEENLVDVTVKVTVRRLSATGS